jgi:predicted DNA-binding transcriptional regulator
MSQIVEQSKKSLSLLAPSVQKVYQILQAGKQMRFRDIQSQTRYSYEMVRYALRQLVDKSLVAQVQTNWVCYFTINR